MTKINKTLTIFLAVSVFLIFALSYRSCKLTGKSAILQDRVEELSLQNEQMDIILKQERTNYEHLAEIHNKELDKIREEARSTDVDHNSNLYKKTKELEEAEKSIVDKDELIVNLREQNLTSKQIVKDLEFKLGEKQRAFESLDNEWKQKETDWINFTAAQNKAIEGLKKEIKQREALESSLKSDLKKLRLGSNIKTGIVLGAAAAVVYGLVK